MICCWAIYGQKKDSTNKKHDVQEEYIIDRKKVSSKYFKFFLSQLKEVDKTWFCTETALGGATGYDAKDKKGNVYMYRFESATVGNTSSLIRKKQ